MKTLIAFSLTALISIGFISAQSYQKQLEQMQKRVENRLGQQRDRVDLRFANQMRRLWIQKQLNPGLDLPNIPKPDNPTIFDPADDLVPNGQDFDVVTTPAPTLPAPKPKLPTAMPAPSPEVETAKASLESEASSTFFGTTLEFRYPKDLDLGLRYKVDENKIAQAWEKLDESKASLVALQLVQKANRMALNDWGMALLVANAGKKMFPYDKNARTVFHWFALSKAGYISTVCYDRGKVFLMLPAKQTLYGKTFLKGKDNRKFYVLDLEGTEISPRTAKIFDGKYPEAGRVMDISIRQRPNIGGTTQMRKLRFAYRGGTYHLSVPVNKQLVNFYRKYPFTDLNVYMAAPLSAEASQVLTDSLGQMVASMPQDEAVNFLLRFVQTAFAYKTDQQQFGKERYLFAEETLYYPYSDCEDRSVLFAYLVKEILDLEVVGLVFPGHAATAVHIPQAKGGDSVRYQGKSYVVCDPTYINATYGMTLPDARGKSVKVVAF
ncbi:MAG: hypothetical protein AAGI38_02530 [Bacteroidota bacterium]